MNLKSVVFCLALRFVYGESNAQGKFLQTVIQHFHIQYIYLMSTEEDGFYKWSGVYEYVRSFTYTGVMTINLLEHEFPRAHKTLVVGSVPHHVVLLKSLLKNYQFSKMKWLLFSEDYDFHVFKDIYIPFDCELMIVRKNLDDFYEVTEIYNLRKGFELLSLVWGSWSEGEGLHAPTTDLHSRRQNLNGHIFQLVAYQGTRFDPDQIYLDKMLSFLASAMNFTTQSRYWELGVLAPNGTKTGVYKLLEDGEVDFGTLPFVVTPIRLRAFSFIWPVTTVKTHLFVAVGDEKDWKSYMKPFDGSLWFVLVGWMTLSGTCLYILNRLKSKEKQQLPAVADAFIQAVCPYCAQGSEVASHGAVFLCRLMPYVNALVLLPAYAGAVLAFLTVPIHRIPFQDITGFIDNGLYKLSFIPYTYIDTYFTISEAEVPTIIRKRNLMVSPSKQPEDAFQGFRQLCQDHSKVYIDSIPPDPYVDCHIMRLPGELLEQLIGIAATAKFPYKTLATRMIHRVHSAGLMKLLQEVEMPPAPEYAFVPLDFESVIPLFVILVLMVLIALTIFSGEKLIARQYRLKAQSATSITASSDQRLIQYYREWIY